jgi:hypothetical protein
VRSTISHLNIVSSRVKADHFAYLRRMIVVCISNTPELGQLFLINRQSGHDMLVPSFPPHSRVML